MKSLKYKIGKGIQLYKREGFFYVIRKIGRKIFRRIFPAKAIAYYIDLDTLETDMCYLPKSTEIHRASKIEDIPIPALDILIDYRGTYKERHEVINQFIKWFQKGANLWMISVNAKYAAYIWSIRGNYVNSYYLPITRNDAVLFDAETLPEFRGLGINFIARTYILFKLKKEGVVRVYLTVKAWNSSSLKTVKKGYANILGTARLFHILGKDIVLWDKIKK